jgi:vacuolar-type H+-ATPase subunit I/STV1
MSFASELKDKTKDVIGSVFPANFKLKEEIEKIWKRIDNLAAIADMTDFEGWKQILDIYAQIVRNINRRIVILARNPEKNTNELIKLTATRDAMMTFLSFIESSRGKYETALKNLEQKIQSLEEITGNANEPF